MFGEGLIAIGNAIGACAWAYAAIYITGFITKTLVLWNLNIEPEQLDNWMDIKIFKERDKIKNKKL